MLCRYTSLVVAEFVVEYCLEARGFAEDGLLAALLLLGLQRVEELDTRGSVQVQGRLKTRFLLSARLGSLTQLQLLLLYPHPQLTCSLGKHPQPDTISDLLLSLLSKLQPVLLLPELRHLLELFVFAMPLSSSLLLGLQIRHWQRLINAVKPSFLLDLLIPLIDLLPQPRP